VNVEPVEWDDVSGVRWEVYNPEFRIDFWHRLSPVSGTPAEKMGYKQDSYSVSGALGVQEVLAWADKNAEGRSYVIYAAFGSGAERGIIRVHGSDPTRND
jgi:hypothetical protein